MKITTSGTKLTRPQASLAKSNKENISPDSKRTRAAARKHFLRVRDAKRRGVRHPRKTIFSTPRGTKVVSRLSASVILSPKSGNELTSPSKKQRLYTWMRKNGKPFYHGITAQETAKRVLAQEFCAPERMAPKFQSELAADTVRLHIEKSGVQRAETLWEETCRILNDRPPANRSIIPPWADGWRLMAFVKGQPDKIAFLESKFEELHQNPHFPAWSVRRLAEFIRKVK